MAWSRFTAPYFALAAVRLVRFLKNVPSGIHSKVQVIVTSLIAVRCVRNRKQTKAIVCHPPYVKYRFSKFLVNFLRRNTKSVFVTKSSCPIAMQVSERRYMHVHAVILRERTTTRYICVVAEILCENPHLHCFRRCLCGRFKQE